jgi:hypothetical protein
MSVNFLHDICYSHLVEIEVHLFAVLCALELAGILQFMILCLIGSQSCLLCIRTLSQVEDDLQLEFV